MPQRLAPSLEGALTVGLKEPSAIALRTCPFRFAINLCGAPQVPDAVQSA